MAKSPYNELPKPLDECLPKMFATYPDLCVQSPSSWFVWTDDLFKSHNQEVCHFNLKYVGPGWDNLITAVPKSSDVTIEYIRMLIRGPFRSFSHLIHLNKINDKYYLHCSSLDKWPSNVLMNFCIATRIPIEFDYLLSPWSKLVEIGYNPVLAFLLVYSRGQTQGMVRTFDYNNYGHLWLDPASDWKCIISGDIQKVSKPYKTNPSQAIPSNVIWGHTNDYAKLISMTDEQISDFYGLTIKVFEPPKPPVIPVKHKKMPLNYVIPNYGHIGAGNHVLGEVEDDG